MSTAIQHEQLFAASKISLDISLNFVHNALGSFEKLASLNLSRVRHSLSEQSQFSQNGDTAKSLQDFIALQTTLFQAQFDQALAYSRDVYAISAEAQEALLKNLEYGQREFNHLLASSLENLQRHAKHSDVAVNAVKSAINAANAAFENANKAARQVASITEAGVKAASHATGRVVEAANQSARKKAA